MSQWAQTHSANQSVPLLYSPRSVADVLICRVNLYGIITIPAPYFPFAMLGMDLLNGGPGAVLRSFTGMVAAHAYYFLSTVRSDSFQLASRGLCSCRGADRKSVWLRTDLPSPERRPPTRPRPLPPHPSSGTHQPPRERSRRPLILRRAGLVHRRNGLVPPRRRHGVPTCWRRCGLCGWCEVECGEWRGGRELDGDEGAAGAASVGTGDEARRRVVEFWDSASNSFTLRLPRDVRLGRQSSAIPPERPERLALRSTSTERSGSLTGRSSL